jgi:hypothetical protein
MNIIHTYYCKVPAPKNKKSLPTHLFLGVGTEEAGVMSLLDYNVGDPGLVVGLQLKFKLRFFNTVGARCKTIQGRSSQYFFRNTTVTTMK